MKVSGVAVEMNGVEYVVPPLTLRMLQDHAEDIDVMQSMDAESALGVDRLAAVVRVAHAAMSRNYPDLTADDLHDLVDLANVSALVDAVLGVSGLTPTREVGSPGES